MAVNGRAYDWESLTVTMDGIEIGNLKSVDWSDTRGITPTYGVGGMPRGWGRRNYRAQASMELADESVALFLSRAALVGGVYNMRFNLVLQYGNNAYSSGYGSDIHNTIMGHCRVTRRGGASRQGVAEARIQRYELEVLGGITDLGVNELAKLAKILAP